MQVIQKASRHGWKSIGVAFLGNAVYTVMQRNDTGKKIYIYPTTGRVFSI